MSMSVFWCPRSVLATSAEVPGWRVSVLRCPSLALSVLRTSSGRSCLLKQGAEASLSRSSSRESGATTRHFPGTGSGKAEDGPDLVPRRLTLPALGPGKSVFGSDSHPATAHFSGRPSGKAEDGSDLAPRQVTFPALGPGKSAFGCDSHPATAHFPGARSGKVSVFPKTRRITLSNNSHVIPVKLSICRMAMTQPSSRVRLAAPMAVTRTEIPPLSQPARRESARKAPGKWRLVHWEASLCPH